MGDGARWIRSVNVNLVLVLACILVNALGLNTGSSAS